MRTEEHKAVVHRFMHEVLATGNVGVVDDVLAPNYVKVAMGDADRARVKAMADATNGALKEQRFEDEELVAGNVVFARFNYFRTLQVGSETMARTVAYYRLADGRSLSMT